MELDSFVKLHEFVSVFHLPIPIIMKAAHFVISQYRYRYYISAQAVLWIGIVLIPIRIQFQFPRSILMPIQIRIRILPQVLHMLEDQKKFD